MATGVNVGQNLGVGITEMRSMKRRVGENLAGGSKKVEMLRLGVSQSEEIGVMGELTSPRGRLHSL